MVLQVLSGIVCDGAKPSCAGKLQFPLMAPLWDINKLALTKTTKKAMAL